MKGSTCSLHVQIAKEISSLPAGLLNLTHAG